MQCILDVSEYVGNLEPKLGRGGVGAESDPQRALPPPPSHPKGRGGACPDPNQPPPSPPTSTPPPTAHRRGPGSRTSTSSGTKGSRISRGSAARSLPERGYDDDHRDANGRAQDPEDVDWSSGGGLVRVRISPPPPGQSGTVSPRPSPICVLAPLFSVSNVCGKHLKCRSLP